MKCGTCEAALSLVDRAEKLLESEHKVRENRIVRLIELQEEIVMLQEQVKQSGDIATLRERIVNLEAQLILERDQHSAELAQVRETARAAVAAASAPKVKTPMAERIPKVKRLFHVSRGVPSERPPEFTVEMETILRKVGCDAGMIRRCAKAGLVPYFFDPVTKNYWFKRKETEDFIRNRYKMDVMLV